MSSNHQWERDSEQESDWDREWDRIQEEEGYRPPSQKPPEPKGWQVMLSIILALLAWKVLEYIALGRF